jgi:hypothetical protein
MLQSSSETTTTTPTPISPFSSYSVASEATSDGNTFLRQMKAVTHFFFEMSEQPDLGAFTQVFREFNHIQASLPLPIPTSNTHASTSSLFTVSTSLDSYKVPSLRSQRSKASYISRHSDDNTHNSDNEFGSGSHTERDVNGPPIEIEDLSDLENMDDPPSLGYLDSALSFIAAERARVTTQHHTEKIGPVTESAWRHVVKPQRTRRRKKPKLIQILQRESGDGDASNVRTPVNQNRVEDVDYSSSSSEPSSPAASRFKSTPATPSRRKTEKHRQRAAAAAAVASKNPRLHHSRSTPSLRLPVTLPLDPRILQLRALAHKLRLLFTEDNKALSAVLSNDLPDNDFVDPRGPQPQSQDTLIHVFVDQ